MSGVVRVTKEFETFNVSLGIRALPGRIDPNLEIFAIGDVHGQAAALRAVLTGNGRQRPILLGSKRLVIFLGDLIDHGPDSIGAVKLRHYSRGDDKCGPCRQAALPSCWPRVVGVAGL
ncbi:MAG: hypothetical protein ACJA1J_002844 [Sulfitobacter pontiacus]|jgi:hypothetical protein